MESVYDKAHNFGITSTDMHIAHRVRLRRMMMGMTQQDLAFRCNVSFQQIQKYESGANRISASRLFDIGVALETPISFFFIGLPGNISRVNRNGKPLDLSEPSANDPLGKNESLELIRLYWELPTDDDRRAVFEMIEKILEKNS